MKLLLGALGVAMMLGQAAGGPVVLHPLMKDVVAAQAAVLWDVGNRAMDDNGNPSAKALKPNDWVKLEAAAKAMKDASAQMAGASKITVAAPGVKIQDSDAPGAASMSQIQGFIDADPKGFAAHAAELAGVSDAFFAAAKAKDAKQLNEASGKLDEICEGCHLKFWYPNAPK